MTDKKNKRVAIIRTSDRIAFKGCRRKWDWSSHLRQNLGTKQVGDPLWLGSAMHYALEDYHGRNVYKSPALAIQAYAHAYGTATPKKLPDDWQDLLRLGVEMMQYYLMWLKGRDPLTTYVRDGIPQVEVGVNIPIPMKLLKNADKIKQNYDEIVYSGQLDRVIIDEHGALWLVEYKSAKIMSTTHYLTDPQISVYIWMMRLIYPDMPIGGVVYQQHKKALPKPGRALMSGTISTAANQATTHRMYRQTLIEKYGDNSAKWPKENVTYLNELARKENQHYDDFIRRDFIQRNKATGDSLAQHLLMEIEEMLDPDLKIYPNPTRMCNQICSFMGPCVSMDDGSDWKLDLELETEPRTENYWDNDKGWRGKLPDPKTFTGLKYLANLGLMNPEEDFFNKPTDGVKNG